MFIYAFTHPHITILKPSQCLNSIPRQVFCINLSRRIQFSLFLSHARCSFMYICMYVCILLLILKLSLPVCLPACVTISVFITGAPSSIVTIYIYSYVYWCNYRPSYQHFKTFPVSEWCLNLILRPVFCINFSRRIQIS